MQKIPSRVFYMYMFTLHFSKHRQEKNLFVFTVSTKLDESLVLTLRFDVSQIYVKDSSVSKRLYCIGEKRETKML